MNKFSPVFDHLNKLVQTSKLPSAVFGVANKDGVVALDAFGAKQEDAYLLWSVTKPTVGLAMLQLCERGLISLSHEVKQYLPWFGANRTDKILLWNILTHTAGISEMTLSPSPNKREYLTGAGVNFRAGTQKQYSNQAFVAQEEVLMAVTGQTLEDYMQANIFQPLGMGNTSFNTYERDPKSYIAMQGLQQVAVDIDRFLQLKHPAAGLFSTAGDLLKLGQCMLNEGAYAGGRIMSPLTLREMTQPQTVGINAIVPDDWTTDVDFGLTWIVPARDKGILHKKIYGHNGWGGCKFWVYPEEGVCFALMTNLMSADLHGIDLNLIHNLFSSCL